jgi:hypothetical protein
MSDIASMLDELICTSIQKTAQSGIMVHDYRIPLSDLGRIRKTEQLVSDFERISDGYDIGCSYDASMAAFRVRIDLNRCVLTRSQASSLSTAMTHYQIND